MLNFMSLNQLISGLGNNKKNQREKSTKRSQPIFMTHLHIISV